MNKPILSEEKYRKKLLEEAKFQGFDRELLSIWEKYDRLLKVCKNETERKHIAIMGNVEIHRLFGFEEALIVGGKEIIPAKKE